ncbi:MAG: hypothetical protein QX199_00325 [Methylococcaceae bacterium]
MIIDWVAAKAQQFLPVQDAGLDELSVSFDFALSSEIMGLLYAQNEPDQQTEVADDATITRTALDEHELALA